MRVFSIVAVTATYLLVSLHYVRLIRKRSISPALAMWVFAASAAGGSLLTYLGDGRFGPLDNIINTADVVVCGGIAISVALWGDRSTRFNRFDLGCLGAVVLILVVWAFTRQHVAAHSAMQMILVIAYLPAIKRLWCADRNTESFVMWIGTLLAPIFSLLSSKGALATVYAARGIVSASVLILLMLRAEWRSRRAPTE